MLSEPPRRIISNIYDAALMPDLWPAALQSIMDAVGAVGAGYCVWNRQTGRAEQLSLLGPLVDTGAQYVSYYQALDPHLAMVEAAPPGSWVRLSESLPRTVLRSSEWYNDFLLKAGIDDAISVRLFDSGSRSVMFGMSLKLDQAPLGAADIAALQELLGPLGKAARLHTELLSLGWRSSVALQALDQLAAGVVVTDGAGRVIELNQLAERIVRSDDGLMIRNGRLDALGVSERETLAKLIAAAAAPDGAAMGRMRVGRRGGRLAYLLTVAPLGAELTVYERPLAMILVADPDELSPSESDLAQLFDLSPAESRLAAALMTGKKLSEIAIASGVRITTLRTQLSSILHKVGVDRQADLVRVLSTIPGISSSPDPGSARNSALRARKGVR